MAVGSQSHARASQLVLALVLPMSPKPSTPSIVLKKPPYPAEGDTADRRV